MEEELKIDALPYQSSFSTPPLRLYGGAEASRREPRSTKLRSVAAGAEWSTTIATMTVRDVDYDDDDDANKDQESRDCSRNKVSKGIDEIDEFDNDETDD